MERSRLIVNFDSSCDKLLSTENVVARGETFDILFRDVTLSGTVRVAFWDYETLLWRSEGSASQRDGGSVLEGLIADTKELADVFRGGSGFFAARLTVGEQVGGDEWRDYGVAYVRLYSGTDPSENPPPARPDIYPTEEELNAWLDDAKQVQSSICDCSKAAAASAEAAGASAKTAAQYANKAVDAAQVAEEDAKRASASAKAASVSAEQAASDGVAAAKSAQAAKAAEDAAVQSAAQAAQSATAAAGSATQAEEVREGVCTCAKAAASSAEAAASSARLASAQALDAVNAANGASASAKAASVSAEQAASEGVTAAKSAQAAQAAENAAVQSAAQAAAQASGAASSATAASQSAAQAGRALADAQTARGDAQSARDAAKDSETAAAEAAKAADDAAEKSAGSAQSAAGSASSAAASATQAQAAKSGAEAAKAGAESAKAGAEAAKAGAESAKAGAEAKAQEAATSATAAASAKNEAQGILEETQAAGATAREFEFPHFTPDSPLLVKAWSPHLDNNNNNLYTWAIVHPPSNAVYANTMNYRGEGFSGEPCILMATAEGGYYYTQYAPNLRAPDTAKYVYLLDKDYKLVQRFDVTNLTDYTFNASCAAVGGKFFAAYASKLHRFDIATGALEKTVSYANSPYYTQRYLQIMKWNPRSGHLVLTVNMKTWLFDTELNNLGEAAWNDVNSFGFVYEGSLYIIHPADRSVVAMKRVDENDAIVDVDFFETDGETPLAAPFYLNVDLHTVDADRYTSPAWAMAQPAITYDNDAIVRMWDGVRLFNARLNTEGHLEFVLASEVKSGGVRVGIGLFVTNRSFTGTNANACQYAYVDIVNKTVYIKHPHFIEKLRISEYVTKDFLNSARPVVLHMSGNEDLHIPTTQGSVIITRGGF